MSEFSPPGNLAELLAAGRKSWSEALQGIFAQLTDDSPQFVDPTKTEVPGDAPIAAVQWSGFPATQRRAGIPDNVRWKRVDDDRGLQGEYCEWSVLRDDAGDVRRVTFTTETPEYDARVLRPSVLGRRHCRA